jgi:hypothetical protein
VRAKGGASLHSWSFDISVKCADKDRPLTPLTHDVPNDVVANVFSNVTTVEIAEPAEPNYRGVTFGGAVKDVAGNATTMLASSCCSQGELDRFARRWSQRNPGDDSRHRTGDESSRPHVQSPGRDRDRTCDPYHVKDGLFREIEENQLRRRCVVEQQTERNGRCLGNSSVEN